MQIKEAKIFNFGKLQNETFRFEKGINVIYGANERGKTTLHAFLTGMLFGIEKSRGRGSGSEVYGRYEPWHGASFYSGALRFEVDEKPFYLERNFYKKDKREYLRNEADGEELSVAYGDLEMLLGGIGREEFENTYDIPQTGAVTGKAMSELLTTYLAEAEAGGNGKVHVLLAQKNLTAQKKELAARKKELKEEKQHLGGASCAGADCHVGMRVCRADRAAADRGSAGRPVCPGRRDRCDDDQGRIQEMVSPAGGAGPCCRGDQ